MISRGRWLGVTARLAGETLDYYEIFCDLAPDAGDMQFARDIAGWLGRLQDEGAIVGWRLSRRKLGLGIDGLGEFHIIIEVRDLAQLDVAFNKAASRAEPAESLHHAVNHVVRNARFALYRDFPDPVRVVGQERF